MKSAAAVGLLLCGGCAAVDQCTDAACDGPVRVFDGALGAATMDVLLPEVMHVFEAKTDKTTRSVWLPFPRPEGSAAQTAMEHAARHLYQLAFGEAATTAVDNVAGAEIWAQVKPARAMISPHYDKDEATFQKDGVLRVPHRSTVTYLSAVGGPTLILNQSVTPGAIRTDQAAGLVQPALPTDSYFVFPKQGRHCVFSGDLWHQVRGDMAPTGGDEYRVTFLINWWAAELPEAENRAVRLTPSWAERVEAPASGKKGLPPFAAPEQADPFPAAVAADEAESKPSDPAHVTALFVPRNERGERALHYRVPPLQPGSFTHLTMTGCYKGCAQLSRANPFMAELFRSRAPKVLAFVEATDLAYVDSFLPEIANEFGVAPLVVDVAHSYLFLSIFGMSRVNVPTVVAFDEDFNAKDQLPQRSKGEDGQYLLGANVTAAAVRQLLDGFMERREAKVERLSEMKNKNQPPPQQPDRRPWMKEPSEVATHSFRHWLADESNADAWADFNRLCLQRSLIRRTSTAKGSPTVCLVFVSQTKDPGESSQWELIRQVVDSTAFRPAKNSYEFLHMHHKSEAAERLLSGLGIEKRQDDFVVAIQELWSDPQRQISEFPVSEDGWGTGENAIGAFGKWVVSLESEVWEDLFEEDEKEE